MKPQKNPSDNRDFLFNLLDGQTKRLEKSINTFKRVSNIILGMTYNQLILVLSGVVGFILPAIIVTIISLLGIVTWQLALLILGMSWLSALMFMLVVAIFLVKKNNDIDDVYFDFEDEEVAETTDSSRKFHLREENVYSEEETS